MRGKARESVGRIGKRPGRRRREGGATQVEQSSLDQGTHLAIRFFLRKQAVSGTSEREMDLNGKGHAWWSSAHENQEQNLRKSRRKPTSDVDHHFARCLRLGAIRQVCSSIRGQGLLALLSTTSFPSSAFLPFLPTPGAMSVSGRLTSLRLLKARGIFASGSGRFASPSSSSSSLSSSRLLASRGIASEINKGTPFEIPVDS